MITKPDVYMHCIHHLAVWTESESTSIVSAHMYCFCCSEAIYSTCT